MTSEITIRITVNHRKTAEMEDATRYSIETESAVPTEVLRSTREVFTPLPPVPEWPDRGEGQIEDVPPPEVPRMEAAGLEFLSPPDCGGRGQESNVIGPPD